MCPFLSLHQNTVEDRLVFLLPFFFFYQSILVTLANTDLLKANYQTKLLKSAKSSNYDVLTVQHTLYQGLRPAGQKALRIVSKKPDGQLPQTGSFAERRPTQGISVPREAAGEQGRGLRDFQTGYNDQAMREGRSEGSHQALKRIRTL